MKQSSFLYSLEGQETERLYFRPIQTNDFDTWLTFCKDERSLQYIFSQNQIKENSPEDRCKIWFDKIFHRYQNSLGGMNALINKQTGEFIGQCGLLIQTVDGIEELEIGYSLMPQHRKMGYALEAASKCKNFAFENNFKDSLISIIDCENQPSINVALSNGMHLEKNTFFGHAKANIYRIKNSII